MNTLQRIFVMLFLVNAGTSPVWADNAVYIDQVGSGVDIDITQDGSGNKVGANDTDNTKMNIDGDNVTFNLKSVGSTNKVLGNIVGDDNILDIDIDGDTNTVKLEIDPTNTFGASNGDYVIDLDGGNNTIDLKVGNNDAAGGLDLDWAIDGDYNDITADIDVGSATNAIDFLGSNVKIDYDASGYDGHSFTLEGVGTTNYWDFIIKQESTLQTDYLGVEFSGSGSAQSEATVCISQSDSGTADGC